MHFSQTIVWLASRNGDSVFLCTSACRVGSGSASLNISPLDKISHTMRAQRPPNTSVVLQVIH